MFYNLTKVLSGSGYVKGKKEKDAKSLSCFRQPGRLGLLASSDIFHNILWKHQFPKNLDKYQCIRVWFLSVVV